MPAPRIVCNVLTYDTLAQFRKPCITDTKYNSLCEYRTLHSNKPTHDTLREYRTLPSTRTARYQPAWKCGGSRSFCTAGRHHARQHLRHKRQQHSAMCFHKRQRHPLSASINGSNASANGSRPAQAARPPPLPARKLL
eukprot:1383143-Rhodomonas_salina.4